MLDEENTNMTLSKNTQAFVEKKRKWVKLELIFPLCLLPITIYFLIKAYINDSKFDIVLYSFLCCGAFFMFVTACYNKKWLKIVDEIENNKIGTKTSNDLM
jgi:hypothetical protein